MFGRDRAFCRPASLVFVLPSPLRTTMTVQNLELPLPVTDPAKAVNSATPLLSGSSAEELRPDLRTDEEPQSSELYGYVLMALSTVGFSGMSLFTHIAENKQGFPPTSAVFVRAIIQTTLSYLYIVRFLNVPDMLNGFTSRQWKLLISRGITGSVGVVSVFTGLQKLPVGDATSIFFCGPVITMLLSGAVLGEPITVVDYLASAISFAGIILVARPGFGDETATISTSDRIIGSLASFAGAWLSAISYITVRSLGRGIHFMASVFSLGFASIFTSVFLGGFIGPADLLARKDGTINVVWASLFAFAGQVCLNKGLQNCRAGPGVLIRNLDVPLAYMFGLLFLGEAPSWFSFAGACLVVTATLVIGLRHILRS